jgi:hypothetical protein
VLARFVRSESYVSLYDASRRRKVGLGRRIARWVAGIVLVLVGLVFAFPGIPGPGLLIVIVGLVVLLPESRWLQRKYVRLKRRYPRLFRPVEKRILRRTREQRARRRAA